MDRLDRIERALEKLRDTDPDWDSPQWLPVIPDDSKVEASDEWANSVVATVVGTLWSDPSTVDQMKARALRARRLRTEKVIDLRDRPQPERAGPRPDWAVAKQRVSPS